MSEQRVQNTAGWELKNRLSVAGFLPFLARLPICLVHVCINTADMLAKPYRNFINLDDNLFAMSAPAPFSEIIPNPS